ncbi:MAG: efflux RND transporter periplasmic adaptor subunit [Acidobacteriaceae bacterium]|nr:efflux RND transporter periplasmic adaptor subunit [Acidobacteriaceae bacterium]
METELKSLRIDRSAKTSPPSKPVGRYIALAVVVVLIGAGALFAYQRLNAAVPVHVVQVQSPESEAAAGEQIILTATGYIVAHHKIEVASKVVGRVAWIGVEKGDHVNAGQVLVRLEDDEYRAQVQQSEGQLENLQARLLELQNGSRPEEVDRARADREQAQADLENAKVTLDRTKQLVTEGVLAKQSLDDAQAKYDSAAAKVASLQQTLDLAVRGPRKEEIEQVQGQIEQARGSVDYARTQLENTVIKAPVSGTILDRNVERGEFVTNGFVGDKGAKGYLVTMADLNDLQVELDISQNDLAKLAPDQKGIVTTDAYPDRKYKGYIEEISPEADRAKATVQVKVKIQHPDAYLRPDMNSTVSFYNDAKNQSSQQTKTVVTVPASSVRDGAVFVVVDGRARRKAVTTGGTSSNGVLIDSGLIGGEELVTDPPADLKDGQRVKVV